MWIALYIVAAATALSGVVMVFQREYWSLSRVWLPLGSIGTAITLFSFRLLKSPYSEIGVWVGLAITGSGLGCNYIAKRRSRKQDPAES